MNETPDNPPCNKLGPGIDEPTLIRAIERSGYPLQGVVADTLKASFNVTEEWGYIDRDTKEHRSLDIFAFKKLSDDNSVQPNVALLVECKRSIHPYVCFRSVIDREIPDFPKFVGLSHHARYLRSSTRNVVRDTPIQSVLGLSEFTFVRPGPVHCPSFAIAHANGKNIALSGGDCFNSLILPLVKAIDQATTLYGDAPPENASCIYPTLILAIGVIDAPMLVVNSPREASAPVLTPWVRVPRHERNLVRNENISRYYGIDLVHVDFFETFLSRHLMLFINELCSRARKQSAVLRNGGSVKDLDNWQWHEITSLG